MTRPSEDQVRRRRTHARRWASLALTLVTTSVIPGCQLGPEFELPDPSIAPQWEDSADARIDTERPLEVEWWQQFDDATLDDLIRRAHDQNLSLRAAGVRIYEARARLGRAEGDLYPQLQSVNGGYARYRLSDESLASPFNGLPSSAGVTDKGRDNYVVGFAAFWELDVWGRIGKGVEIAENSLEASVATYDDLLVSLSAEVALTYLTLRTLDERLVLARESVQIQTETFDLATSRFENGATSELDVAQALAQLRNTQALVPALEHARKQARNALAGLLGIRTDEIDPLLGEPNGIPTPPADVAVGIPADLLRRRPDIRLAELQAASQCARIGIAEADLYPTFSLGGAIGTAAEDIDDLFGNGSRTGIGGPYFQWKIFNYGRIKNDIRAQDAAFQASLVNYEDTVLRAQREVEDALTGFLKTRERSVFLGEGAESAKRAVELAVKQYRQGAIPFGPVLDAQQQLTFQQDLVAESQGNVSRTLVTVYRSLGGGWESRESVDRVPESVREEMRRRTNWGELIDDDATIERRPDEE